MIAEVVVDILNNEIDRLFDYEVPTEMDVHVGDRVAVSFARTTVDAYVVNLKESSEIAPDKLKPISKKLSDTPMISAELMQLVFFMKNKFFLRYIDIIKLLVPNIISGGKLKKITKRYVSLTSNEQLIDNYVANLRKNATKPIQVIAKLRGVEREEYTFLSKLFSNAVINKMIEYKVLVEQVEASNREVASVHFEKKEHTLTECQANALSELNKLEGEVYLLHGVTGSGKTEVYLRAIENVLNDNKTAIMLVPEISLTPQMVGIFKSRFGDKIAVLHSKLSPGERFDEWNRIFEGEASIVVGARSAIFAPLKNLGVIIIDEEHDGSYFSDSNPRYFTHDVAAFRAKENGCNLILGSATPSVEAYFKAEKGDIKLLELPVRVRGLDMPQIEIVDMTSEFRGGNKTPFSKNLIEKLHHTITNNNQAILFINRRGYSSFLMCRDCGHIPSCTKCDVSLVYHRQDAQLKCHYCGNKYRVITRCPNCRSENIKLGGVGTQQVVAQLKEMFSSVEVFRLDNDTTQRKDAYTNILTAFSKTKPSVLVGTQMVAKGHDFPDVSLVGILDADLSLFFNDYKSSEKTFQLITQVAGRAGRAEKQGKVVLQTFFPKHHVYNFAANYNYKKFYEKEINLLKTTLFPPFSKIVRVLISSEDDDVAKEVTHISFMALKELRIKNTDKFYFLEAMRSPIGRIKNKFRYQIIMRFAVQSESEFMQYIYDEIVDKFNKKVTLFVELNPQSLS